ncbi:MAG: hypothetical protein Fur0022_20740 [Anaerolineales bacterium]
MKKYWLSTLLLLLILTAAACGGPATEAPADPTAVTAVLEVTNTEPPAPTEAVPPATEPPATPTETAPVATEVQPTEPVAGPTFNILSVVNRDITQAAFGPSLAVGATTPGAPPTAWIAWVENSAPGSRQIFVSEWNGEALQPRGASLNLHLNVLADSPSITFAGENAAVPWVVWVEPSPGFGDILNTFASRFNVASGLWQPAGQDRGDGEPSLNSQTNRPAGQSVIAGGSGDPTLPPAPWVVWSELGRLSNFTQLFVSKGIKDESGIGGFIWQLVGELRHNDEPTLNVDVFRHALRPSIIFAETGNAVPWITWHEEGADRPSRIFTARGVADAKVPGGFKWVFTPACDPDEIACSLNLNPLKDAKDATMAAGSITPGEATVPWITWAEVGPTGKWQVFVSRLDPVSRASFVNVGGSLNVDQNQDARHPIIVFLKNVPYVSWEEDDGSGNFRVHLRHLASDPQTGTWVLDSPAEGFDHDAALSNSGLTVAAGVDTLFLAWVEGDPATEVAQVILAAFKP